MRRGWWLVAGLGLVCGLLTYRLPSIGLAIVARLVEPELQARQLQIPWNKLQADWLRVRGSDLSISQGIIPLHLDEFVVRLTKVAPPAIALTTQAYGGTLKATGSAEPRSSLDIVSAGRFSGTLTGLDLAKLPVPPLLGLLQGTVSGEILHGEFSAGVARHGEIKLTASEVSFVPSALLGKMRNYPPITGGSLWLQGSLDETGRLTATGPIACSLGQGTLDLEASPSRSWRVRAEVTLTESGQALLRATGYAEAMSEHMVITFAQHARPRFEQAP